MDPALVDVTGTPSSAVYPFVLPSRLKPRTMAQDSQAQAIRKRKATLKIARLKAAAEGAPQKTSTRKGAADKKAAE